MNLRNEILDILQAMSIIIVFITVFFSIKYPYIVSMLQTKVPVDKPKELQRLKNKLWLCFGSDCLPLLVLDSISVMVTFPLTRKIIENEGLRNWSYESLPLAYLIITFWVVALFAWIMILSLKILLMRLKMQ